MILVERIVERLERDEERMAALVTEICNPVMPAQRGREPGDRED